MNPTDRRELERNLSEEIGKQKGLIASLAESAKPIPPNNAIGRLTRMEAIHDRSVSQAALNSARNKLAKLEKALGKVNQPDFGICMRCSNPIPHRRIMLMPESTLCVPCAEKR